MLARIGCEFMHRERNPPSSLARIWTGGPLAIMRSRNASR